MGVTVHDLRRLVSFYAGFGMDYGALAERDRFVVDDSIATGYQRFLAPEDTPSPTSGSLPYEWRFLKQTVTIVTAPGQWQYDAPAGVHHVEGALVGALGSGPWRVEQVGVGRIIQARQATQPGGRPVMFSFSLAAPATPSGATWRLSFYPTPDSAYELSGLMQFQGTALSDAFPDAICDQQSEEALRECCLAVYESRWGDRSGVHEMLSTRALARAIAFDKARPPDKHGYNRDGATFFSQETCGPVDHRIHRFVDFTTNFGQ